MTIERTLVVSTANITEETADWLNSDPYPHLVAYPKADYGWWIYAHLPPDPAAIPVELQNLIKHAQSLGCTWLMLDRDAYPLTDPDFPTYDW